MFDMKQITTHHYDSEQPTSPLVVEKLVAVATLPVRPIYRIKGFYYHANGGEVAEVIIPFQQGPTTEKWNGITMEAMAAVLVDRLLDLQAGEYPCFENAEALRHFEHGLNMLHLRSKRIAGIED